MEQTTTPLSHNGYDPRATQPWTNVGLNIPATVSTNPLHNYCPGTYHNTSSYGFNNSSRVSHHKGCEQQFIQSNLQLAYQNRGIPSRNPSSYFNIGPYNVGLTSCSNTYYNFNDTRVSGGYTSKVYGDPSFPCFHYHSEEGNREAEVPIMSDVVCDKLASVSEKLVGTEKQWDGSQAAAEGSLIEGKVVEGEEKAKELELELETIVGALIDSISQNVKLRDELSLTKKALRETTKQFEELEHDHKELQEQIVEADNRYNTKLYALQEALQVQVLANEKHANVREPFDTLSLEFENSKKKIEELEQELLVYEGDARMFEELHKQSCSLAELETKRALQFERLLEVEKQRVLELEKELQKEWSSFNTKCEAYETNLFKQREDFQEWERKLQVEEERFVDGQRFLNQRDHQANENDRILRQKQSDLEDEGRKIDATNSVLRKKEVDMSSRITILILKEKKLEDARKSLDMKERALLELQQKLKFIERKGIQKLVDELGSVFGHCYATENEMLTSMNTAFITLWDSFATAHKGGLMSLVAMNLPTDHDEAIIRSFSQAIELGKLYLTHRTKRLKVVLKDEIIEDNIALDALTGLCEEYTRSYILAAGKQAALVYPKEYLQDEKNGKHSRVPRIILPRLFFQICDKNEREILIKKAFMKDIKEEKDLNLGGMKLINSWLQIEKHKVINLAGDSYNPMIIVIHKDEGGKYPNVNSSNARSDTLVSKRKSFNGNMCKVYKALSHVVLSAQIFTRSFEASIANELLLNMGRQLSYTIATTFEEPWCLKLMAL